MTVMVAACGGSGDEDATESETADCDGHGELHDDHCHCDDGYSITSDGMGCEEEEEADTDTDTDSDTDTNTDTDVDTGTTDTGPVGDPFDPDEVDGSVVGLSDGSTAWLLVAKDGQTHLSIENYPSYGGATGPETRAIDAVDTDYATCGMCLLLQTDCELHGDHYHCGATFMPEEGGQVVTDVLDDSVGGTWSGQLSGIRFVEVEIGNNFQTTVVDGGDSFFLRDWGFEVELSAQ